MPAPEVPLVAEELSNTPHYTSLSASEKFASSLLPGNAGKRRPLGTASWQLDIDRKQPTIADTGPGKLPPYGAELASCSCPMTIFGGAGRGGHIAGAGHAAVGMNPRRATAPTPPQYLEASLTPPPTSGSSRAATASRDGGGMRGGQPLYERTLSKELEGAFDADTHRAETAKPIVTRTLLPKKSLESDPRRSTTGLPAKRSKAGGLDSLQVLEDIKDDNRTLREELARLQSTAVDSMHRRPLAGIAGGGFRATQSTQIIGKAACMCESLKSKLWKCRQDLHDTREENRLARLYYETSLDAFPMDARDNEVQTSPKVSPQKPPQTAPYVSRGASIGEFVLGGLGEFPFSRSVDARTQTVGTATVEACCQAFLAPVPQAEAEAQTASAQAADFGVQAGSGISQQSAVETQTPAGPAVRDSASQIDAAATGSDRGSSAHAEVATQAGSPSAVSSDTAAQTDAAPDPRPGTGVEVEVQCSAEATASAAAQTEPAPAAADAACEAADFPPPDKFRNSCAAASQTLPPDRSAAAVQTSPKPKAVHVSTQAALAAGIDSGCQAEDNCLEEAMVRVAQGETRIEELEAHLARLSKEREVLKASNLEAQESAKAFKQMAHANAFGQMNVTILCPRAECTVSGERIEMDSWNPQRLREEFEREVLPRFTRVFVDETPAGAPKGGKVRSEAVDKAMQEFAETFRERLTAMLSAPNANAAVQAAAAAKAGTEKK